MHGLPVSDFLGRVLGIGFLGLDPAGAVVALAAIAVGARRRGLTALTVSFLATMTLIGVLILWLTTLLDSGGTTLDRVGRGILSALSRSKLVVRIVLAIGGLALIVLGTIQLLN